MLDNSNSIDLTDKTAIVTGAAMGIGQAIAERLHSAGARVAIADTANERLAVAQRLEEKRSMSAMACECDVSDEEAVAVMVDKTIAYFGQVDILVNNAGIFPQAGLLEMDSKTFDRVLAVNLRSLFLTCRAVAEHMIEHNNGGRIINITSIDALHPSLAGLAAYDASKHGAWGFTKNIALELAQWRITVNAIAPGLVLTPGVGSPEQIKDYAAANPLQRYADPDEIAAVALFLASPWSSYMTGSQIVIDGGRLLA